MKKSILAACVLCAASCLLCSCEYRSDHYFGKHHLEIVETGVQGNSSSSHSTKDGPQTFTYESEKLKVRLEDGILTVNGERYRLLNEDDAVRIKDGRVEINGQPAKPVGEKAH